jgi:hypothetical protein
VFRRTFQEEVGKRKLMRVKEVMKPSGTILFDKLTSDHTLETLAVFYLFIYLFMVWLICYINNRLDAVHCVGCI